MNIFRYDFVCLRCIVLVSVHYRLCLVRVRMKVLQNGRSVRFSERTDCLCAFSCSICNQTATWSAVSRAAVCKVMTAYTNHGKTSSGERKCGRKPKLSERDRRTLRGLCLNITELLQQRWQQNSAFILKTQIPQKQSDESTFLLFQLMHTIIKLQEC